ncbi:MAG: hypothetical protein K9J82_00045 [Methylotenera sp.]|nr:hypothetical protein [Methylotenera sp.]
MIKQLDLWRVDQAAHLERRIKDPHGTPTYPAHKFQLKDPLLRALILADQPSPGGDRELKSWVWGKALGAVLLTWFAKRALDLYRLPYHEDRLLSDYLGSEERAHLQQLVDTLTPLRIDAIAHELRELHAHTQTCLAAKGLTHVQLRRGVRDETFGQLPGFYGAPELQGQAGQIVKLKLAAEMLGHGTVQFEMDTLNSWGDDGGYGHFPVHLHRRVAAADVLYCSTLLAAESRSAESGEWVVINRHPAGLVEFDVGDIEFSINEIAVGKILPSEKEAMVFMKRNQPLVYRSASDPIFDLNDRPHLPTSRSYRWRKALAEWLLKRR